MTAQERKTEELLERITRGDAAATQELFEYHRSRLASMVRARMDSRLTARFDPSDIVQDTLVEASKRLTQYAQDRNVPFYPWLRNIAWEKLIQMHRKHLAERRSVRREVAGIALPAESEMLLGERFAASASGVSGAAVLHELQARVQLALEKLTEACYEVVVLRHIEELSFREIAVVLGITETAVYSRYRRAVEQLAQLLKTEI